MLIKWVHAADEPELAEARALRDAHVRGDIDVCFLDLGLYEVGNVLLRALSWPAQEVSDTLRDLLQLVGPVLVLEPDWVEEAARLGGAHTLTFYDAAWAAVAAVLGIPLSVLTAGC